jgi:hypothetical protein
MLHISFDTHKPLLHMNFLTTHFQLINFVTELLQEDVSSLSSGKDLSAFHNCATLVCRKRGYAAAEQHFYKSCRLLKKIAIADMQLHSNFSLESCGLDTANC